MKMALPLGVPGWSGDSSCHHLSAILQFPQCQEPHCPSSKAPLSHPDVGAHRDMGLGRGAKKGESVYISHICESFLISKILITSKPKKSKVPKHQVEDKRRVLGLSHPAAPCPPAPAVGFGRPLFHTDWGQGRALGLAGPHQEHPSDSFSPEPRVSGGEALLSGPSASPSPRPAPCTHPMHLTSVSGLEMPSERGVLLVLSPGFFYSGQRSVQSRYDPWTTVLGHSVWNSCLCPRRGGGGKIELLGEEKSDGFQKTTGCWCSRATSRPPSSKTSFYIRSNCGLGLSGGHFLGSVRAILSLGSVCLHTGWSLQGQVPVTSRSQPIVASMAWGQSIKDFMRAQV